MRFSAHETSTSPMVLWLKFLSWCSTGGNHACARGMQVVIQNVNYSGTTMPSSEVRYQRGDVYRPFDEDILRARRSSSSTTGSSVLSGNKKGGHARSRHSGVSAELHHSPLQARCSPEEYLTKKKVSDLQNISTSKVSLGR